MEIIANIPKLYSPDKIVREDDSVYLVYPMMRGKTFEQVLDDSFKKDTPINFDLAFSIAFAIADLIDSAEAGGKVVGLEGGWGTGKSTVVNLLQQRLHERDAKYSVITFDAWAHESDPLRRTYLETLIRHLQGRKWVDRDAWDKMLERMANRRREESTKIVPKPTSLGVLLAISLVPVPLEYQFAANAVVAVMAKVVIVAHVLGVVTGGIGQILAGFERRQLAVVPSSLVDQRHDLPLVVRKVNVGSGGQGWGYQDQGCT